jgi:hypothetical protein
MLLRVYIKRPALAIKISSDWYTNYYAALMNRHDCLYSRCYS